MPEATSETNPTLGQQRKQVKLQRTDKPADRFVAMIQPNGRLSVTFEEPLLSTPFSWSWMSFVILPSDFLVFSEVDFYQKQKKESILKVL